SSGLRINSAKDDAAGQAIANRMTAQITGLSQAQRNANDGISIAQTAEGGLDQVNDNLQRIRELTVQAQNGTNSASDIDSIQQEVNERLAEIDRIASETDFNGSKILSNTSATTISIQVGSQDGQQIDIELNSNTGWNKFDDTGANFVAVGSLENPAGMSGTRTEAAKGFDVLSKSPDLTGVTGAGALADAALTGVTDITDGTRELISYENSAGETAYALRSTTAGEDKIYAVTFNADKTPNLGSELGGEDYDLANQPTGSATVTDLTSATFNVEGKGDALSFLDDALKAVDEQRSSLGAIQNRFESAITNLSTNETNLSSARSRIEDADYAVEVANMTRAQILQQAGTSVLAQANQVPQSVLSLLG
ncbi:MAG: FliC/FljB family flagellin, partial [Gammaproteobacteria bacterium]|nr:FliC/FljB family flagellin [Gammaproteobacteria bacterium]